MEKEIGIIMEKTNDSKEVKKEKILKWLMVVKGKKILVTGASGFVGLPLALDLAKTNKVHGIARFRDDSVRRILEDARMKTIGTTGYPQVL